MSIIFDLNSQITNSALNICINAKKFWKWGRGSATSAEIRGKVYIWKQVDDHYRL